MQCFRIPGKPVLLKEIWRVFTKGTLTFEMISNTAKIKDGDEVVTSHVSDKFYRDCLLDMSRTL